MNHRIVSAVVLALVALFLGAAGLFALAGVAVSRTAPVGPQVAVDIPHPPARLTEGCLRCHSVAKGTIPTTHRYYPMPTCGSCHGKGRRVQVPHSTAMGDVRCPVCHGDPGRDLGMPRNHLRYETKQCLLCHPVDTARYAKSPARAGLAAAPAPAIPHETTGVFRDCTFCHQLTGRNAMPQGHELFAAETCLDCHRRAGEPVTP